MAFHHFPLAEFLEPFDLAVILDHPILGQSVAEASFILHYNPHDCPCPACSINDYILDAFKQDKVERIHISEAKVNILYIGSMPTEEFVTDILIHLALDNAVPL